MKKWISLLLTLVLLLSSAGFSAALAEEEEATTVTFVSDPIIVAVGKSDTVNANASPYAAAKKDVEYSSSDESIAKVTSKGKVTGVAEGTCQIIATSKYDPTVSASQTVQVILPVKKLIVTSDTKTVLAGSTLQLNVGYEPTTATLQSATYTTLNQTVASVSDSGLVTGLQRGTATITVRSADGYAKANYKITVLQAPESVTITPETAEAAAGRKVQLKVTVLPSNTNDKSVVWTSADESIATVSTKGAVTFQSVGQTTITATCNGNTAVTASIPVRGLELAQSVAFDSNLYTVIINQTLQLSPIVLPDTTTDPSVTYKVGNKRIATVDENGLITGLKGGKTSLYVYTADGSKKKAKTTIEVVVPVTGVSYKHKDVRVGSGSYSTFTATIAPSDATDKAMTWVSSDTTIAAVTGTTNRFKVKGLRWGRCKVTGTTEDGGFTVEVNVDVGTLRKAIKVVQVSIKDGKPYLHLKNASNMNITQVRFEMLGYDQSLRPVQMSTKGDLYTLGGAYDYPLAEGESTRHGTFTFYNKSTFPGLSILQFCITGWSTDTGYYDSNGVLQYNYNISKNHREWITYPANTDTDLLK